MFIDAERRFAQLEKETKRLHDESKKYFEAINSMLTTVFFRSAGNVGTDEGRPRHVAASNWIRPGRFFIAQ